MDEALKLPPDARAEMAAELLRRLDRADSGEHEVDRLWGEEIARPIAEIETGAVAPLFWEEAQRIIDPDDPPH